MRGLVLSTPAAAVFGLTMGWTGGNALMPDVPLPPVQILSVEWDAEADKILYERRINSPVPIRAPYRADVVESATERSVPACEMDNWTTISPEEGGRQHLAMTDVYEDACAEALVIGRYYEFWLSIQPVEGRGTIKQSAPFVWEGRS